MEKHGSTLRISYTDKGINSILGSTVGQQTPASRHFSQNEEFFLRLGGDFLVPSFHIHHDVRIARPSTTYLETLGSVLSAVVPLAPQVFSGMTYFFDPSDILGPGFYQMYRIGKDRYLYLLKMDLSFKTHDHEIVRPGTNDTTPEYRTRKLFLEGTIIPLSGIETLDNQLVSFTLKQMVSQTWIGETGRGYFVQGIWIDHELTKFFSRLFLPRAKHCYPYYPFQCKYKTICLSVIDMDGQSRKKNPPRLHRAIQFVGPFMPAIQRSLRNGSFSEDLPAFVEIKKKVPEYWRGMWDNVSIGSYLNDQDMREFAVESKS